MKSLRFKDGFSDGIPIALGYLFVSFGFGILAVESGLSVPAAVIISLTNMTSAGQAAAVSVIASAGSIAEMALTQLIINIRYSVMGISLSQKLDGSVKLRDRFAISFGVTDEVFAVSSVKDVPVGKLYMLGLILLPYFAWGFGTFLGAVAGTFLPELLKSSMGILLYGMFIAIFVPPAQKDKGVLFAVLCAAGLSCLLEYAPALNKIPSGFGIIICAIISSVLAALLFPKSAKEARQ